MQLHLSKRLRAVVMAGFSAVAAFSATPCAYANQLFWNGGDGNFIYPVWTDAWGNDGHDFAPGSEVYFQGIGGTIDAIDDPDVGTMEVNGNYSFISTGHLTVYGALRVGDGKTGTFDALPKIDDGGIEVNYDATLDLTPIAVNQGLMETVSHKVADYSAGTVKFQGTADTETLTNHITFRNNVLVDGGLRFNGAESDGYLAIQGEEWDERTFTLTGNLQLEGGAKFLVGGGILDARNGILLGCEEGGSGGKIEMTGGKFRASSITLVTDNENTVEVTGGELTFTGGNAFACKGEGTDKTAVSISNATLIAEYNDYTFNHGATLTDVTVVMYDWSKVTIGAEGQETVIGGTLTNESNDVGLVLLGNITMKEDSAINSDATVTIGAEGQESVIGGTLTNTGDGEVVLLGNITMKEGASIQGNVSSKGENLTLAAGENVFESITADSLFLTDEGTELTVTDELAVNRVVIGHFGNTITARSLANDAIVFDGDEVTFAEGVFTLMKLVEEEGISAFSLEEASLSGITLKIADQTFTPDGNTTLVEGTGYSLALSLADEGKTLLATVSATPEPSTATLSLLALAGLAFRRRRGK